MGVPVTIFTQPNGKTMITWEPGDEPDWTTPNSAYRDHEFCGNCGLDVPGCGCPRDCGTCQERRTYCGHLRATADTADDDWGGVCEHDCDDVCEMEGCSHSHCFACGECGCAGYCDDYQTYNLRPSETGGQPDVRR